VFLLFLINVKGEILRGNEKRLEFELDGLILLGIKAKISML
jgi:hypothetical protein